MRASDQRHLIEVTGRTAESLEILARALHVKDAELQPTLAGHRVHGRRHAQPRTDMPA